MKALRSWWNLPSSDRRLVIQVAFMMIMVRLALRFLPVKITRRLLAWDEPTCRMPAMNDPAYKDRVVWAVSAVGRQILGDGPCLTQALATQWLLKRRGYRASIHIGVTKDRNARLVAHAWVESDGVIVIGGSQKDLERYTRLPSLERGWQ